mgnify:FL=1
MKGSGALLAKDTRHYPFPLVPESKSDVNSISCAGFPFKQYRAQIERIDRYMGNAEYKKTLSAVNKLTEELFTLGRLSKK